jgi:hypothetical protein
MLRSCSAAIRNDDDSKTRRDPNDNEPAFRPAPLWAFFAILAVVAIVGMVASFWDCGALVCRFWITHMQELKEF